MLLLCGWSMKSDVDMDSFCTVLEVDGDTGSSLAVSAASSFATMISTTVQKWGLRERTMSDLCKARENFDGFAPR